jgi:transposase-like protein
MQMNQRYTKEEMWAHIEQYQQSGLTQYRFCQQTGLSKSTFGYWLKKYRKEQHNTSVKKTSGFLELRFEQEETRTENQHFQICFPNGVQLSCPANTPTEKLLTLIRY